MGIALRDLLVNAADWVIPYLAVETDAWAPDGEVLVSLRSLGDTDEARREIAVELTIDQLRGSPLEQLVSLPVPLEALRRAPLKPHPRAGGGEAQIPTLDEVAA